MLFDIDDTLVNSRPAMEDALKENARALSVFASSHGLNHDPARIHSKLVEIDERMHATYTYNRDEWWRAAVMELWPGTELKPEEAGALTKRYWEIVKERSAQYPDSAPVLAELKKRGYRLAAVTDTDGTRGVKTERLRRSGLMEFFDAVVIGGEDTKKVKPDPEPFLLAASKLGLRPGECVMVGDRPYTDIRGAKAAGMSAIWLKRRDWDAHEPCEAAVDSLLQLTEILKAPAGR